VEIRATVTRRVTAGGERLRDAKLVPSHHPGARFRAITVPGDNGGMPPRWNGWATLQAVQLDYERVPKLRPVRLAAPAGRVGDEYGCNEF
jgi:hypothetical protein